MVAAGLSSAVWGLLLVALLGSVGLMRGFRAEAITLVGIVIAALATSLARELFVGLINQGLEAVTSAARMRLAADTPDESLLVTVAIFLSAVLLFYGVASSWRGKKVSPMQRLAGMVVGGLNGFVIALTLTTFAQDYLSRHPSLGPFSRNLPPLLTSGEGLPLSHFTPLATAVALVTLGVMALATAVRSRR